MFTYVLADFKRLEAFRGENGGIMEQKIGVREVVTMLGLPGMERGTVRKLLRSLEHRIAGKNDLVDYVGEKTAEHKLPKYYALHFDKACKDAELILRQSEKLDIRLISFLDDCYPPKLLDTGDFPVILNYKGDIGALSYKPNIALVGTRERSEFGREAGERLGEFFGSLRFNVVSGLAKGCDTAAHAGALKGKGTITAVLAHGLD